MAAVDDYDAPQATQRMNEAAPSWPSASTSL